MRKRSQKETSKLQLGCLACFTSIFFFVGIGLLWGMAIRPTLQVYASRSWNEVDCTIQQIELRTHAGDDGNTYSAQVEYAYSLDNRPYIGNRFWFSFGSFSDRRPIQKAISRFEKGGEYVCYVNPENPNDSVLLRELGPSSWLGWLIGGLFAIVGGVFSASLILAMKKTTTKKEDPVAAHSPAPILLDHSMRPKNASLSNTNDVREYAYDVVPLEPDAPDEPIVLSTRDSRLGTAIACWFFAAIWNSITWAIAYFAWRDGSWFGIAFSSIFILVGIVILFGAVYATLQIFNPKPTLVCSQNRLYPGTEFEISWTHRGNTGRIQQLHITLEGIEEATFKQGTSSRTERSLFHQQTIVQTNETIEINEGFRVLTLPLDTMHSFKSSRNAILWILKVHGKIAWWPDMTDQFPITIYPPALESEPRT